MMSANIHRGLMLVSYEDNAQCPPKSIPRILLTPSLVCSVNSIPLSPKPLARILLALPPVITSLFRSLSLHSLARRHFALLPVSSWEMTEQSIFDLLVTDSPEEMPCTEPWFTQGFRWISADKSHVTLDFQKVFSSSTMICQPRVFPEVSSFQNLFQ